MDSVDCKPLTDGTRSMPTPTTWSPICRGWTRAWTLALGWIRSNGPLGIWEGGREKARAAICRKVIQAKATGNLDIEIWGDGKQTRSFMYIDDCLKGTRDIMGSDIVAPINLGSSELTTINGLVDVVEEIAGVKLKRHYKLDAPKAVNGRNSDNSMVQRELGWAPSTRLRDGLERTFQWINDEYAKKYV